jgi:hypothetical protein
MRRLAILATLLPFVASLGCSQETATASLRALNPVGDVSLLCLGRGPSGAFTEGRSRDECPDYEYSLDSPYNRRLHAMVTQPASGEVALVDLAVGNTSAVLDYEPTQPGYSFMPVGAEPGSIVSTPGGVASFVGVREGGREGLFALPSSCIGPRAPNEPLRDIRTWPACRLPAAPGPMVMLVDPAVDDDGDPATPPRVRASCDGPYADSADLLGQSPAARRAQCPADLARESSPEGRRKLAVTLPSLSEIWVIDAQELLDREPGSYDLCNVEERYPLQAQVTDAAQEIPADLVSPSPACDNVGYSHGPPVESYRPLPVDVALDDEARLYIADAAAPVVHVIDVSDPCSLSALPSLETRSYSDPTAMITTRKVAVSSLTPAGKRFVYAVDDSSTATSGMLMAFDVSPGSANRTPIVRERSAINPAEPPDRIALGRDVADVEFVSQDFPEPSSGVAVEGVACDPDPTLPADSPGAEYRPSPDLATGAAPRKLRGTFAFAATYSGQMGIVDVEDLDAACRRPVSVNPESTEDLAGCKNDSPELLPDGYQTPNGLPTVSAERSCNIVEPHRARSRGYFIESSAGLVGFPALTLDTGRAVTTDQSTEGLDFPKMLGARHTAGESEALIVGPLEYSTDGTGNHLEVDPAKAATSSLLLSYEEPRNFVPSEEFVVTYEGTVRDVSEALFEPDAATGLGIVNEGINASFCTAGIQDMDLVSQIGQSLGVSAPEDLAVFARDHADYVQIVSDLSPEDDPYWGPDAPGGQCGQQLYQGSASPAARVSGRPLCEEYFRPIELQQDSRDFRIVEAREDTLTIEPRSYDPTRNSLARRQQLLEFASCCFPGPTLYQVRAGRQWVVRGSGTGFAHRVTTDPTSLRCVSDCNPTSRYLQGRALEISCSGDCPNVSNRQPAVGLAVPGEDFVCVVDSTDNGIDPGEQGSECVFQNLTTRFAVYRGRRPSRRDMQFRWQFTDGFTPLGIGLTNADRPRSTPQSIVTVPELGQLIVTDGTARGLTFVSTRNPGVIAAIF